MPAQRHTAASPVRAARLPVLAGIGLAVLLAGGAATAYLVTSHPGAQHHPAILSSRVVSSQTVGLVAQNAQSAGSGGQLVQLLGPQRSPQFTLVSPRQQEAGAPQWTADQMAGNTWIFIYLPTGDCLSLAGSHRKPGIALLHCDLAAGQRWRRTSAVALTDGHSFFEYANARDGKCLSQADALTGSGYDAGLAACASSPSPNQLIAFWWSSS